MHTRAGQITIEYFLLFAAIILVTMIGFTTFHTDIAAIFQRLLTSAKDHMPMDDGGPPDPNENGGVPTDPGDPVPPTELP